MFTFIALIAAATTTTVATAPAEKPRPVRYCAENMSDGTPYPLKVCKTRADWIKLYGIDPVKLANDRR